MTTIKSSEDWEVKAEDFENLLKYLKGEMEDDNS